MSQSVNRAMFSWKKKYKIISASDIHRLWPMPGFVHNALRALQSDPLSPKSDNFPPKVCPYSPSLNHIYSKFSLSKITFVEKCRQSHLRSFMGQICQDARNGGAKGGQTNFGNASILGSVGNLCPTWMPQKDRMSSRGFTLSSRTLQEVNWLILISRKVNNNILIKARCSLHSLWDLGSWSFSLENSRKTMNEKVLKCQINCVSV